MNKNFAFTSRVFIFSIIFFFRPFSRFLLFFLDISSLFSFFAWLHSLIINKWLQITNFILILFFAKFLLSNSIATIIRNFFVLSASQRKGKQKIVSKSFTRKQESSSWTFLVFLYVYISFFSYSFLSKSNACTACRRPLHFKRYKSLQFSFSRSSATFRLRRRAQTVPCRR